MLRVAFFRLPSIPRIDVADQSKIVERGRIRDYDSYFRTNGAAASQPRRILSGVSGRRTPRVDRERLKGRSANAGGSVSEPDSELIGNLN